MLPGDARLGKAVQEQDRTAIGGARRDGGGGARRGGGAEVFDHTAQPRACQTESIGDSGGFLFAALRATAIVSTGRSLRMKVTSSGRAPRRPDSGPIGKTRALGSFWEPRFETVPLRRLPPC